MAVLFYLGVVVVSYTVWSGICLYRNFQEARKIGLPIIILPIGLFNPFLQVLNNLTPSLGKWIECLPFGLGFWGRFTRVAWMYGDGGEIHRLLGPAFVLCMPSFINVVIAEPGAAHRVMTRRKEFVKPTSFYESLNIFGPNVNTTEGEIWQRHRRLTAPSLNERVSASVWNEAFEQCREMLQEWKLPGIRGTYKIAHDTCTLALHVWLRAGFGIPISYHAAQAKTGHTEKGQTERPGLHRMSYAESLFAVMQDFILLVILPQSWLRFPLMPKKLQRLGQACAEFELYIKEMLEKEKAAAANGDQTDSNLLSALVRASEAAWGTDQTRKVGSGLQDNEILGNLWVYSVAGFETTANVLAVSIACLALHPVWQDWIAEEIQSVLAKEPHNGIYEEVFPKLKRCLAIMFESLRISGSIVMLLKSTASQVETLDLAGKTCVLPPNTLITVNIQALHDDPSIWGSDAAEWRPDRWIVKGSDGVEQLIEPRDGTFYPWAEGPRVCPGRRFAQVEFVSVLATIFRRHTVSPVATPGQSEKDARAAVVEMLEDSGMVGIIHKMRNPEKVAFAWEERKARG